MASVVISPSSSLSVGKTSTEVPRQKMITSTSTSTSSFSTRSSSSAGVIMTGSIATLLRTRCVANTSAVGITTEEVGERSVAGADSDEDGTTRPALSEMWREIQGCNDWEELVDPLDSLLRDEVLRYGEFVNACYKAFDLDPNSKRYLTCKHGKRRMLKEVGLESSGYEVTSYIYATPDVDIPTRSSCGRWIGYVAVSADADVRCRLGRRDIIVAFRGTVTSAEWVANFLSSLTPASLDPHDPRPEVMVESGLLGLYISDDSDHRFGHGSCRQQLHHEIWRLINEHKHEDISITLAGHSMGSSLALLFGYDLAEVGLNVHGRTNGQRIPITVYSFAGPRVGNLGFKDRCKELGVKVLRVVNVKDPITKIPGAFLNENLRLFGGKHDWFPWRSSFYAHVGVELSLDFFTVRDPSCVHDLGHLLRLLRRRKMVQVREREEEEGTRTKVDLLFSMAREFFKRRILSFALQISRPEIWKMSVVKSRLKIKKT